MTNMMILTFTLSTFHCCQVTFNLCYRYIDEMIVFNNKKFIDYVKDIYHLN